MPAPARPKLLYLALFAAVYLLGAWLGYRLTLAPAAGITLWAPSGLMLGVLAASDRRRWGWWVAAGLPAAVAGSMGLFGLPFAATLASYLGTALEAAVGAWLLQRRCGAPFRLESLREVLALTGLGAALAPVLGATIGAATLAAAGRQAFAQAWPLWWVGDAAGVLVFTPLVLAARETLPNWRQVPAARWLEAAALAAAMAVGLHAAFALGLPLTAFVLPFVLWAALRFRVPGAALTMAVCTAISVHYTASGRGAFAGLPVAPELRAGLVYLFLAVVSVSALVLAALTQQRRADLKALQRAREDLEIRVAERTGELRESERRLQMALDAARMEAFEHDAVMQRVHRIGSLSANLGLESDGPKAAFFERIHPEDREPFLALMAGLSPEQPRFRFEYRLRGADGEWRWLADRAEMHFGEGGSPLRVTGISVDITDRKRTEGALAESEEKYRTLLGSLQDGVFVAQDYRFVFANPALPELLGYNAAEFAGLPFDAVIAPEFLPLWNGRFARRIGTGAEPPWRYEVRLLRKDGSGLWAELSARLIHYGGRPAVLGILRNTTDRKAAEEALRASEERFRAVFEHAGIGIALTDGNGYLVECNPAFRTLFGLAGEGPCGIELADLIHPEDREAHLAAIRRLEEAESACFEIENRCLRKTGEAVWVRQFVSLLRDARGRPAHFLALVSDMTERRRLEEALKDADQRKDEFLAMLAHELRNPLAPIRNSLQVLRRIDGQDVATSRLLDMMQRQLIHMIRLVDDLLEVSRITRGKIELRKEPCDLRDLLSHAVETSRPLIDAANHRLSVSLPPEPVPVEVDPVRIAQVLANLLNNAAKYMEAGGAIRAGVARDGDFAVVSIGDAGVGISADMLPLVFDLFTQVNRSIDRAQGGLGIGLALVRRLVEMHGGRVEARSEGLGRGSEFRVYLPLAGLGRVEFPGNRNGV